MFYFGYAVPEGTKTFWGCRAILDSRGKDPYVDFVYDRQSIIGELEDTKVLSAWLNSGPLRAALDKATELFRSYMINASEREEFVLYEDDRGIVISNPNASYGYLYVSAYFKE